MIRVEKLPKIEGYAQLEREIEECKQLSLTDQPKLQANEVSLIVEKIFKERQYWSRWITLSHFTCGINVTERTEFVKLWLQKGLIKREAPLTQCIDMLLNFEWLSLMQDPDMTQERLISQLGNEHCLVADMDKANEILAYDEFKVTKSHLVDQQPILSQYIKANLTQMALERCKYAIGQALKYFRLLKGDKGSKTFLLQHVNPNHLRELNCDLPPEKKLFKVRIIEDYVFCTCMEYFNTGLPCTH